MIGAQGHSKAAGLISETVAHRWSQGASMVASGMTSNGVIGTTALDQASRAFPLAAITGHGTLKLALL